MTSQTERRVAAICADVLGLVHVGDDEDLYELGGDSHQAVLIALELERVFEVDLPLEMMESSATARALAAWIDDQRATRPIADSAQAAPPAHD